MFFKKPKPSSPTHADTLVAFRHSLYDMLFEAGKTGVSLGAQAQVLQDEAADLRRRIDLNAPVLGGSMYDVERLKIKDPPKPTPTPQHAPLRYPQSNDAADVAAYWNAMEARQRGR